MNTDRLVLSHPLNCIEHRSTYEAARSGEGWVRECSVNSEYIANSIFAFIISSAIILVLLLDGTVPFGPFELTLVALINGIWLAAAIQLWRQRNQLKQLPHRRLPEEQAIVDDVYTSLNARLAHFWLKCVRPKLDYYGLEQGSEYYNQLKAIVAKLVELDGKLYEISQLTKPHATDERAQLVRLMNLEQEVDDLLERELPP
ncbi:MAG: hypothetical protein UY72_C0016G0008 [Candidatus Uhrbacteria bacterium GW2011_GWD2_52_7]|uniref:Uncharacterized protein n=1 Tax=Candidatus Uhrbacteria bacterium GW2011_GWD2_52_7 TaxID=1618989 RepID=A0A0G1XH92_9BACT|nr:MAG: hypothetical protein UY72_C0016G0008 [Candidatus Uhrbacteria bacterium GW2011_GWD2_52_7]